MRLIGSKRRLHGLLSGRLAAGLTAISLGLFLGCMAAPAGVLAASEEEIDVPVEEVLQEEAAPESALPEADGPDEKEEALPDDLIEDLFTEESDAFIFPPELEDSADRFLWIGDSRTEGVHLYAGRDVYCAVESAGCKWLTGEGWQIVQVFLDRYQGDTVLLCFGINDLTWGEQYISAYREIMARYPHLQFYVVSLWPVREETEASHGYSVTNAQVEEMNRQFAQAFGAQYLDIYHWLRRTGFESNDGVHYTPESCRSVHACVHLRVGLRRLRQLFLSSRRDTASVSPNWIW